MILDLATFKARNGITDTVNDVMLQAYIDIFNDSISERYGDLFKQQDITDEKYFGFTKPHPLIPIQLWKKDDLIIKRNGAVLTLNKDYTLNESVNMVRSIKLCCGVMCGDCDYIEVSGKKGFDGYPSNIIPLLDKMIIDTVNSNLASSIGASNQSQVVKSEKNLTTSITYSENVDLVKEAGKSGSGNVFANDDLVNYLDTYKAYWNKEITVS